MKWNTDRQSSAEQDSMCLGASLFNIDERGSDDCDAFGDDSDGGANGSDADDAGEDLVAVASESEEENDP